MRSEPMLPNGWDFSGYRPQASGNIARRFLAFLCLSAKTRGRLEVGTASHIFLKPDARNLLLPLILRISHLAGRSTRR